MNLFSYGTLIFPDIWETVAGAKPNSAPANLADFTIRRAAADLFPVVFPKQRETVAGLLYFDVSDEAIAQIDLYESEIYDRVQATVTLENGFSKPAEVYVLRLRFQNLASEETWTAAWFEQNAKAEYMRRLSS